MASRIDGGSRPGYLIPGVEFDSPTAVDREGVSSAERVGSGFGVALPQTRQYAETPATTGLQDLFSLDNIVPEPSHIAPPPKTGSLEAAYGSGSPAETHLSRLRNAFSTGAGSKPPSPEVQRMIDLLQGQSRASHNIRSRLRQGGSR